MIPMVEFKTSINFKQKNESLTSDVREMPDTSTNKTPTSQTYTSKFSDGKFVLRIPLNHMTSKTFIGDGETVAEHAENTIQSLVGETLDESFSEQCQLQELTGKGLASRSRRPGLDQTDTPDRLANPKTRRNLDMNSTEVVHNMVAMGTDNQTYEPDFNLQQQEENCNLSVDDVIDNFMKENSSGVLENNNNVVQRLIRCGYESVLCTHGMCTAREFVQKCTQVHGVDEVPEVKDVMEILKGYSSQNFYPVGNKKRTSEVSVTSNDIEKTDYMSRYPDQSIRVVQLKKGHVPLGVTIRNEGDRVVVGRIVQGGAVDRSRRLRDGDEILEVNGIELTGKSVHEVCDMLSGMTGTLTFIISPNTEEVTDTAPSSPVHAMHVKAYFDYDPEEDLFIPCRELGMSFQKGDILCVMDQSDHNWWQAYRDGEHEFFAGLIPSMELLKQREAMLKSAVGSHKKDKEKKKCWLMPKKKNSRNKKENEEEIIEEDQELPTYEKVTMYYPKVNQKRPVILTGPPNFGIRALQKVLLEDKEKFTSPVRYTTRPKLHHEEDGDEYYFVSRNQFKADILVNKFMEYEESENAYYGTTLSSIKETASSRKCCLIYLPPNAIKILRNSDLMPYTIFIAPPSIERLRQMKIDHCKEKDLSEIIRRGRKMEQQFWAYFDLTIINMNEEKTKEQVIQAIRGVEREPQWIPAKWLPNRHPL